MNLFWPQITTENEAKDAANRSAGIAFFIAAVSALLAVVAISVHHPVLGLDGYSLVDATVFAIVGWRLRHYSMAWAITGLVLYCIETAYSFVGGRSSVIRFLFIFLFIAGVRATAFLRQLRKQALSSANELNGVELGNSH